MRSTCNGTITLSSGSDIVKNDVILSKLEKKLLNLSKKYGLGEVLFLARNPENNNSTDSFYIRAPKNWSLDHVFDVWDSVASEAIAFLEEEGCDSILDTCGIVVSQRY